MTSKNTNEFYMVLPSNSSPQTHPRNIAADYIVGWDTPIELDPNENWKVALTEASYIYHPHTISSNLSIEYEYMSTVTLTFKWVISVRFSDKDELIVMPERRIEGANNMDNSVMSGLKFTIKDEKYLVITGHREFLIRDQGEFGINKVADEVEKGTFQIVGTRNIRESFHSKGPFKPNETQLEIWFFEYKPAVSIIQFPDDKTFTTVPSLFTYIREHCKSAFSDVSQTATKRMIFSMGSKVFRIKFNGGLNFVLGFYESEFKMLNRDLMKSMTYQFNPSTYQADLAPQLNRGVKNMYIYASCCAPVYVGHTRVPLLKNIFVDASQDANIHGHVRNLSVQNPMYVSVAASTLTSIEINIRNDAGNIIGFPKGSITVLTLHFKKFPK